MSGSGSALIAVEKNGETAPLKSKTFYQQAIPSSTSSITESVSRDFFLNFVDLQNKGAWNVDSQAALIENLSAKYATSSASMLKVGDIAVFSDLDKAKTHDFGNAVIKILTKYEPNFKTSPFDIINDAATTQTGSTTFQERLALISESYISLSKELAKIPAPATLAATYVDVINTYFAVGIDVNNMRSYWSDPVRGLLGLTNYQKDLLHQMDLLKSIAVYLKSNAIIFNNTEDGYIWSNLLAP